VAFIVLFIAAANLANILMARALRRRREVAVRRTRACRWLRLLSSAAHTRACCSRALGGGLGMAVAQFGGAVLRHQFMPQAGECCGSG